MKKILLILSVFALMASCQNPKQKEQAQTAGKPSWAIVIHGGAGNMDPDHFTSERKAEYRAKLTEALQAGAEILEAGGPGLDAVEAAIRIMENSPLFNAGKGAVFNAEGVNELDASIMDGKTLNAGAVANVTTIKNPISAARLVMEKSPHVMLIKEGAEKFAAEQGVEIVEPSYFYTESRWNSLQDAKKRASENKPDQTKKSGTVGCVVLDKAGNLAAGTSTGGMSNKKYGRVGDSPVIGAGTYADNNSCAVSATGHGEFFIRNVVAYDIAARMAYRDESLESAANDVINNKLRSLDANGGVVAIDKDGNIAMPFNTTGMFRGYLKPGEDARTFIFQQETE
ncbi:MAG: isoaspartyl peptidase/L-asparaginase family protein [Bacteroidales bacterium]